MDDVPGEAVAELVDVTVHGIHLCLLHGEFDLAPQEPLDEVAILLRDLELHEGFPSHSRHLLLDLLPQSTVLANGEVEDETKEEQVLHNH